MEITSVVLRLQDREIKVSIEEAQELLSQLNAVFGKTPQIVIQKEYVPYPVIQPQPLLPSPPPSVWYYNTSATHRVVR